MLFRSGSWDVKWYQEGKPSYQEGKPEPRPVFFKWCYRYICGSSEHGRCYVSSHSEQKEQFSLVLL